MHVRNIGERVELNPLVCFWAYILYTYIHQYRPESNLQPSPVNAAQHAARWGESAGGGGFSTSLWGARRVRAAARRFRRRFCWTPRGSANNPRQSVFRGGGGIQPRWSNYFPTHPPTASKFSASFIHSFIDFATHSVILWHRYWFPAGAAQQSEAWQEYFPLLHHILLVEHGLWTDKSMELFHISTWSPKKNLENVK